MKAFGVDRTVSERSISGVYDVNMLGLNYRMNEIQAVLGIEQLKKINSFLPRNNNYNVFYESLSEMDELYLFKSSYDLFQSSYYCISAILTNKIVNKRYELIQGLKEKGIGTSVYYPKPVPHMKYYQQKYGYQEIAFQLYQKLVMDLLHYLLILI